MLHKINKATRSVQAAQRTERTRVQRNDVKSIFLSLAHKN
jgi:hypothetical protein